MRSLLGDEEAGRLEQSLQGPALGGLRVNTLKGALQGTVERLPWPLEPVPWCPAGYLIEDSDRPGSPRPGLHPFHAAGLYYLQEPSAMVVGQLLAPRPGESVLDLAAAPGGKSTHAAALMDNRGVLVANDVNGARARELSRNLERWGALNTVVTSSPVELLARVWPERFDAVLLDAPCSGEGMFRKTPEALRHWSSENVAACALRQKGLLEAASRLVRPGGRLVYSTCTLGPDENEAVVAEFLETAPDWQLRDPELNGVESGRPDWAAGFGRANELSRAVRLWPHRQRGEGHFAALLVRRGEARVEPSGSELPDNGATGRDARPRRKRGRSSSERGQAVSQELWQAFIGDELTVDPLPTHSLGVRADGLYALPPGSPALDEVNVLRPGLWLGREQRGRFIPSHALALALGSEQSQRTLDLEAEGAGVAAYLSGAELESEGEDGWVLVTVAGHPLGWGRRARHIVKNHYPKGLRRTP